MPAQRTRALTNSAPSVVLGKTEPRLWTPPLVKLTPDTSYGFDVIEFAEDIGMPLDPWQRYAMIAIGELYREPLSGLVRPRFRESLIILGRQNGKTHVGEVLSLYWLFVDGREYVPRNRRDKFTVLALSSERDRALESLKNMKAIAEDVDWLAAEMPPDAERKVTGSETLSTIHGARYKIAAKNRRAGRGLTVHRALVDELCEHRNREAWTAATFAMNAVPDAQAVCITTQGDNGAEALHALREPALAFVLTGKGNPAEQVGLFEWSAPDGSDPTDVNALALSNPNLNRYPDRNQQHSLLGAAARAKAAGGEELTKFFTDVLCIRVAAFDPAINPIKWKECGTDKPVKVVTDHRDKLALCWDISLDRDHATLVAAAVVDGVAHAEVLQQWEGHGCTAALRAELPGIVARVRPRVVGRFPSGPSASVAAEFERTEGRGRWTPRTTRSVELRAEEVTEACMGTADMVDTDQLRHPNDPMLTQHVVGAVRRPRGDGFVYDRVKAGGPIDGSYALAGAVHLARTLPPALAPVESA